MLKTVTIRASLLAITALTSLSAHAMADTARQVNIPAGDLSTALWQLAHETGADLVYRPEQVKGLKTRGAHGSLTTEQAVIKLLEDTHLASIVSKEGSILIAEPNSKAATSGARDGTSTSEDDKKNGREAAEGRSFSERFRLAQVDRGMAASASSVEGTAQQPSDRRSPELEEVIVTAQKREERLQDVPVPVTVLGADKLAESNLTLLRDYYSSVPGLNVLPGTLAGQTLSIRGITTGLGNPTVGIMVDDVPFGGSAAGTQSIFVPDIDPGDLARIEVLRGPQGTLYGADSVGGLLKFVTKDPSTDGFSGRLQTGTSSVHNGENQGFAVRGSINIPLTDTLAVRVSAFRRQDPGYIDNPLLQQKGVNEAQAGGGRLTALWKISPDVSLRLSALYQETKANDTSEVYQRDGLGPLEHDSVPGIGGDVRIVQAYSATLKAKLGSAELVSITGYNINRDTNSLDYSYYQGQLLLQKGYGVSGTAFLNWTNTKKFTQELRLSVPFGEHIEWLIGGFYTDERSAAHQMQPALDGTTGRFVTDLIDFTFPKAFSEYSVFTDVTYRFSDRFDVQLGARESRLREDDPATTNTGPFTEVYYGHSSPVIGPAVHSKANSFTYLLTPRFKISADWMAYVRLASGYRPGGPNTFALGVPPQFEPDKTKNYEMGLKGNWPEHAISVDASLYYIDWNHLQMGLFNPEGFFYTGNAGKAKSQGVELAASARPLSGLTISGWMAFDDAVLTERFPLDSQIHGDRGERLPFSSRFSGNLTLQQDFPLAADTTGFIGISANFVGDRIGTFTGTPTQAAPRQKYPAYTKTDLNIGIQHESWTANLFINNVADARGMLNGGIGYLFPYAYQYITPRTVGLSVSKSF